ncbi:MAG: polyprenyl synthetase family protein [Spirochaetaceae bacterium]|jgi:octaprenyl-diphosphate synthase|nr:polyprenyl synthetase family protein [Spirochaetaceae bacterium]
MNCDYRQILKKIEDTINNSLPSDQNTSLLNEIFFKNHYCAAYNPNSPLSAAALCEPCLELLSRGGKRWRPLLMYLVCKALGGGEAALPLSPLVELCHNASLIHDDIEDNSDLRRGKPCIHKMYGIDTAINSGSFLYFLPLTCIDRLEAPSEIKLRLYSIWAENMRRLHLGQSLDIYWHRSSAFIPQIDQYFTMCALKTGVLAKFAVLTGALAAEISAGSEEKARFIAEQGNALSSAAEKIGIAFQILDDVKNLSSGIAGKTRADDIVEGKKSLPVILYLYGDQVDLNTDTPKHCTANPQRIEFMERCFKAAKSGGANVPESALFIAALEQSGAIEAANKTGVSMLNSAKQFFTDLDVEFLDFFNLLA